MADIYTKQQVTVAPPYDFVRLDHDASPRCLVYDLDNGFEVARFAATDRGERYAKEVCTFLNSLCAAEGLADGPTP